ncbi:MAG: bifunctional 4-hydroxy-2-oxoglutarate aldolase/2-dehydro-3-deoxy-phosphogluconate aldolase [Spirochaetota bacterium]
MSNQNQELLDQIESFGIVPVIVLSDPGQGAPLGRALAAGGLPVAEITFRTTAALAGLEEMVQANPEVIVGAGTVATTQQVDDAVAAGARFIVTPGFNPTVVDHCLEREIPIVPGISGTGEIEQALSRGVTTLKYFPAEALGGVKLLKALSGPYKQVRFMPTGGISLSNIHSYLAEPNVVACGGSWLVPKDLLASGDYDKISAIVARSVAEVIGFSVANGEITVPVRYPGRAAAYLERMGITTGQSGGGEEEEIALGQRTIHIRGVS